MALHGIFFYANLGSFAENALVETSPDRARLLKGDFLCFSNQGTKYVVKGRKIVEKDACRNILNEKRKARRGNKNGILRIQQMVERHFHGHGAEWSILSNHLEGGRKVFRHLLDMLHTISELMCIARSVLSEGSRIPPRHTPRAFSRFCL